MPRHVAFAACALLWMCSVGAAAAERVYVLAQDGATLSEIPDDASASAAAATVALAKAPGTFALAPDAPRAYVTHSELGQVSVVDLDDMKVVRTIDVPGSPFGIAVARGGRLFVSDWNESRVTAVDLSATGTPRLTPVDVGPEPGHVLLAPDEAMLYVANREGDSVSVIRTKDLSLAATIPVGHAPFAMAISPDGTRLYVGNVQAGTVTVIDTAKLAAVETWKTGAMPYGAAVTPEGGRVLITHQTSDTLGVFERDGTAVATIDIGSYPEGVAIGRSGTRAYVANWFSDDVSVIDLESMTEIRRIESGRGPRTVLVGTASEKSTAAGEADGRE